MNDFVRSIFADQGEDDANQWFVCTEYDDQKRLKGRLVIVRVCDADVPSLLERLVQSLGSPSSDPTGGSPLPDQPGISTSPDATV